MDIVVRATVIYFVVWIVVRGTGKRELAEMTAFELVLLVTIGDLVQQAVTQQDTSISGGILAIATIAFWIVCTSYVSFRFPGARGLIEGVPVVIVRDGEPVEQVLRIERLTLEELKGAARDQGIADLADVQLCVLEPDGKLSFITRKPADHEPPPDKHVT